jgi:hypothetical protein
MVIEFLFIEPVNISKVIELVDEVIEVSEDIENEKSMKGKARND